ncbi:MAG TPA: asparagine synthase-related protein [Thermoanaerobaculia bacterium]|nr:asparagine synthase-related protein [Thermoanaerobaculia bacterium]
MSGIAGVVRLDGAVAAPETVRQLAGAVAHRGPDGSGAWSDGSVAFVHALLRTTPGDAVQPFVDGTLTVVADARIDTPVPTEGDAATIAAAYRQWGADCVHRLEGDFAFAVWDAPARTLFCARDALGVKPFVYAHLPGKLFAFGSEARALLALPEVPRDLDEQRVADFLAVHFDDRERTFHRALRRLPAGHTLTLRDGRVAIAEYWHPERVRPLRLRGGDAAYAEGFREHFVRAVRERMRTSRAGEVGAMLSGGLDSSSIACIARDELRTAGAPPLPVFPWIFSDAREADEREYQEAVLAAGGMRAITLDSAVLAPSLWRDLDVLLPDGPPYSPNYYLNTEAASAARAAGVRVILDGLGGDSTISRGAPRFVELFLHARWMVMTRELRALAHTRERGESLPRVFLGNVATRLAPRPLVALAMRLRHGYDPGLALLRPRAVRLTAAARARRPRHLSVQGEHLAAFRAPFAAEGLELFDRVMAAWGVEGRYPFFDRRLAEYCLSLPSDQKLAGGYSRIVARRAMAGILPDAVRWRAGKGAPGLHVLTLLRASRAELEDLFVRDPSVLEPWVNLDAVRALLRDVLDGRPMQFGAAVRLWSAAALGRWLRTLS